MEVQGSSRPKRIKKVFRLRRNVEDGEASLLPQASSDRSLPQPPTPQRLKRNHVAFKASMSWSLRTLAHTLNVNYITIVIESYSWN
jgi:hypothetical protein